MRKWLIIFCVVVIAVISYNYLYQDHRDISTEVADYEVTTIAISEEFSGDLMTSEDKYLNKTIIVNGIISEQSDKSLTLDDKVFCQFTEDTKTSINQTLKIQGRVIGYDDLLEQVKLDQCHIIN